MKKNKMGLHKVKQSNDMERYKENVLIQRRGVYEGMGGSRLEFRAFTLTAPNNSETPMNRSNGPP